MLLLNHELLFKIQNQQQKWGSEAEACVCILPLALPLAQLTDRRVARCDGDASRVSGNDDDGHLYNVGYLFAFRLGVNICIKSGVQRQKHVCAFCLCLWRPLD